MALIRYRLACPKAIDKRVMATLTTMMSATNLRYRYDILETTVGDTLTYLLSNLLHRP